MNNMVYKLSRLVSNFWNPVTMSLYVTLIMLFGGTVLSGLPVRLKWYYVAMVAITAVIIPALSIALMRSMGLISRLALDERRERIIPLALTLVCYAVCVWALRPALLIFLLRQAIVAGMASLVLGLMVTLFWKISLHMIAAGAMVAILLIVHIAEGHAFGWLCVSILMAGAVGSARLVLRKHTPAQVAAGFFGGVVATTVMLA